MSLLVRDYALGIVERAVSLGCLDEGVDLEACLPPYSSAPAKLNISDAKLKRVATAAGDDTIYYSSACLMGTLQATRLNLELEIFDAPLCSPAPRSPKKIEESFEAEVIAPYSKRAKILEKLRELRWGSNPFVELLKRGSEKRGDKKRRLDETRRQWSPARQNSLYFCPMRKKLDII